MCMVQALRKRENSVVILAIAFMLAGLIFGIWLFRNSQREAKKHPAAAKITHSTPVGGKLEDGVFRSSPGDEELSITRWRI